MITDDESERFGRASADWPKDMLLTAVEELLAEVKILRDENGSLREEIAKMRPLYDYQRGGCDDD